jgi:hypothetical protein
LQLLARDLRADGAAHRLQSLLAAHALERLRSADGVYDHGAIARDVYAQPALAAATAALRLDVNRRSIALLVELDLLDVRLHLGDQFHFCAIPANDVYIARDVDDFHRTVGRGLGAALHGFAYRSVRNEERGQAVDNRLHNSISIAGAGAISVTSANNCSSL